MIGKHISELDTPCLVIDSWRMTRNVHKVQERVAGASLTLRPHVKAHKILEIAKLQIRAGATGVTAAKLSEAEAFVAGGVTDILVCYPIVGTHKRERLLSLARRARVMSVVDSLPAAAALSQHFSDAGLRHEILVKVDAGFGRVGVPADRAVGLVEEVLDLDGLTFRGLCIHQGTTYGVADPQERRTTAIGQSMTLVRLAEELRDRDIPVDTVSAGSTPGLDGDLEVAGLTQVRPGNYVFNDAIQVGLGVASIDDCALTCITTVVSNSRRDGFIVDAGSKIFGLDRGAHGLAVAEGHGICLTRAGLLLTGLSEEHGWGAMVDGEDKPDVGEVLQFIPNHACSAINNVDSVWVAQDDVVIDRWDVCGRGAVT